MRLALFSLLKFPLAIGCDGDEKVDCGNGTHLDVLLLQLRLLPFEQVSNASWLSYASCETFCACGQVR